MSLADLASLASSVAVVVSLLFLGQNTAIQSQPKIVNATGTSARNVELLSRLSDPGLATSYRAPPTANSDRSGLLRLVQLHGLGVLELRRLLLSVSFGHAGSKSWASNGTILRRLLGNPAYRAV